LSFFEELDDLLYSVSIVTKAKPANKATKQAHTHKKKKKKK
jgi:hypothetical protein